MDTTGRIFDALRTVLDPCCRERGISVVDMGLVHDIAVDPTGDATVEILLTSGWCPFQVDLLEQMEVAVRSVPGVAGATVRIRLDEAWSTARLSPEANAKLRFLPEPAEVPDREHYLAGLPAATPVTTPPSHQPPPEEPDHDR